MSHQVNQSTKDLQSIMDYLKSQGFAAKETQSQSQQQNSSFTFYILFIYTLLLNLLAFTLSHSISYAKWDHWAFEERFRNGGRLPRELPSVLLPRQQSHSFPRAWGEGAVGGILHLHDIFVTKSSAAGRPAWKQLFEIIGFRCFFLLFQVSFSCYIPKYYVSEKGDDDVDGYVLTFTGARQLKKYIK